MISLTCNKKVYPEFRSECNKCPMMVECVINGKSVAVGTLECPTININVTLDNQSVAIEKIAKVINDQIVKSMSFGGLV